MCVQHQVVTWYYVTSDVCKIHSYTTTETCCHFHVIQCVCQCLVVFIDTLYENGLCLIPYIHTYIHRYTLCKPFFNTKFLIGQILDDRLKEKLMKL